MDRQPLTDRLGDRLLAEYGGAAAAYSLRALNGNGDNVVRVRRNSDDFEQDFTAAQVSDGTLVNFANGGTSALYGERMYFDGVDDSVTNNGAPIANVGAIRVSFIFTNTEGVVFFSQQNGGSLYGASITQARTSGNVHVMFHEGSNVFTNVSQSGFNTGDLITATIYYNFNTLTFSVDINGMSGDNTLIGRHSGSGFIDLFQVGANGSSTFYYTGLIYDLIEYGADQSTPIRHWNGYGNTNADWEDQIGSNDGTVNGSPALYSGQGFDGFVATEYDQSGAVLRDGTQSTTTNQPQIVSNGALVTDGNGNVSTIWDGVNDDLDVVAGFAGLTAANVYAVTDNAGVVTLDTLTAQDISADTNLTTILTGITYDKVTAVIIYPDNTNQSAIQSEINTLFGI